MNYEKLNVLVNMYNSDEDYIRLNESIKVKNDQISYTAYDVTSSRIDRGGNIHGDYLLGFQTLSAGLESKQGSVYGQDIYNTSTDIVTNQGKMNTASAYLQDDISLMNGKLNFVLGLRYDRVQFFDGAYTLTEPTKATSILADLENPDLAAYTWGAVSPKAAAKFNFSEKTSAYFSYGYGFRPSILDDLCRSGFVRGGFKKANPNLEPERVNNFELGLDVGLGDIIKLTGSGYYTQGEDFIYMVSTGEYIAMGSKQKPIKEARNISSVETYGAEIGAWASLPINLTAYLSYAYNHSEILDFDDENGQDLIGKSLIYNPAHMLKSGLIWNNSIVNFSLQANWISQQWMDDMNEEEIPAHLKVHAKVWKQFRQVEVFVKGNNLTNVVYLEGHGQLSLGRFISSGIQIHF
jgi:iron complex outermembrane receptor protein